MVYDPQQPVSRHWMMADWVERKQEIILQFVCAGEGSVI